jgi:hypothetical protein
MAKGGNGSDDYPLASSKQDCACRQERISAEELGKGIYSSNESDEYHRPKNFCESIFALPNPQT